MGGRDHSAQDSPPSAPTPARSALADSLLERRQEIKSNVQAVIATLEDHCARGVPISPELALAVPSICATLVKSTNHRHKSVGARLILSAMKYNLDRVQYADKAGRLDSGTPTENVQQITESDGLQALLKNNPDAVEAAIALSRTLNPGGMPDALSDRPS